MTYQVALWSIAFPLGMYAVAAMELGDADGQPIVERIGAVEPWPAIAVWALVFGAMTLHLWRTTSTLATGR